MKIKLSKPKKLKVDLTPPKKKKVPAKVKPIRGKYYA